jgi:hypothetical protein
MNSNFQIIDERSQENECQLPPLPFFIEESESGDIFMITNRTCEDCGEEHYLLTSMTDGRTFIDSYSEEEILVMLETDKILPTVLYIKNEQIS